PAPAPAAPAPTPAPAPAPAPATLSEAEQFVPAWARDYVPTREIYVSPTGNDASSGLSRAAALKTTAAAIGKLAPGVRLNFTAGTYGCAGAFISNFNGGTALPGSIRSIDGPRAAKFDCANADGSPGNSFLLDFVHGFIFEGIELSNSAGHGIQVMSGGGPTWDVNTISSDIVVHASYIHHTGLAGMKSSQARRIAAINNELAYVAVNRQTLEFVAVDEVTLAGNEAHHSGYFDEIKGGARGPHVIFGNYIHDSDGGILVGGPGTGYQFLVHPDADYEARDLKVWNNVIVNVPREAFYVWACHNCVVAHTTYYGAAPNASFRVLPSDFTDANGLVVRSNHNVNVSIVNNLFLSASGFNDMVIGLATETTGLALSHNLWFAQAMATTAGVYSDIAFAGEPASLYASNPLLSGAPANMRPAAASPAVGRGMVLPFALSNFDGQSWNGAPNIGAY
ncbi:MAG: right-handed parallel beta-helix repeat-containing protein, partial [Pseudomonadota bacterium]|nr:right-handed parallel beta-helix repeat-containing protein [Pseudomonadota bacterium]